MYSFSLQFVAITLVFLGFITIPLPYSRRKSIKIVSKNNRKLLEIWLKKEAYDSQEQTSSLFYNSPSMGQSYSWTQTGGKRSSVQNNEIQCAQNCCYYLSSCSPLMAKIQLKTKDFNKIRVRRETSRSSVITGMGNIEEFT